MGWYVCINNTSVREQISQHFRIRGCRGDDHNFANLWPIVSITHDLGYLFEGSVAPLSTTNQSELVKRGIHVVDDYFNHTFWTACGADSVTDRRVLLEMSRVEKPVFPNETLTGVADGLRDLGCLELLRESVLSERGNE